MPLYVKYCILVFKLVQILLNENKLAEILQLSSFNYLSDVSQ